MGAAETENIAAGKPLEVCQSDAFVQRFDGAFCAARFAAAVGAGGVRVRRDREDHDDDQYEQRFQPYVALQSKQSEHAGRDDGDGEPVECECSGGWIGSIYGDGYGEFKYGGDLER